MLSFELNFVSNNSTEIRLYVKLDLNQIKNRSSVLKANGFWMYPSFYALEAIASES
jgi:hypothetical protein